MAAQVHLVADDGGAGVEFIVQLVGGQDRKGIGVLDYNRDADELGKPQADFYRVENLKMVVLWNF